MTGWLPRGFVIVAPESNHRAQHKDAHSDKQAGHALGHVMRFNVIPTWRSIAYSSYGRETIAYASAAVHRVVESQSRGIS